MRRAELFDGTTLEFPDDTSDDVIARVARAQTDRIRTEQARRPLTPGVTPGDRNAAAATDPRRTDGVLAQFGGEPIDYTDPMMTPDSTPPGSFRGPSGEVYKTPTFNTRDLAASLERPLVGPPEELAGGRSDIGGLPPGSMQPFGGGGRRATMMGQKTDPAASAVAGAARGIANVAAAPYQLARAAGELTDSETLAKFGQFSATAAQEARDKIAPHDPKSIVQQTFESVFTNVPVMAGLGFGNRALLAMGSISAAQAYQDAATLGLSPVDAAQFAAAQGVAEMLGEKVSLPQFGRLFREASRGAPVSQLGTIMAEVAAREQVGEQATQAMQSASEKVSGVKPGLGMAEYVDEAIQTAKVTLGQTLVMGGGAAAVRSMRSPQAQIADVMDANIARVPDAVPSQPIFDRMVDAQPGAARAEATPPPGVSVAPAARVAPPYDTITTHDMPTEVLTPTGVEMLGGPTLPKVADEEAPGQQGVLAQQAGDIPVIERGSLLAAAEARLRDNAGAVADATGAGTSVPVGGADQTGGVGSGVAAPVGAEPARVGAGSVEATPGARPTLPVPGSDGAQPGPLKYDFPSVGAAQAYIAQERLQNIEAVRVGNEVVLRPKLAEPTQEDVDDANVQMSRLKATLIRVGANRIADRVTRTSTADPKLLAFAEVARAVTGRRPIFVMGLGHSGVAAGGNVFIDTSRNDMRSDQRAMAVTWHEVTHTLEQTDPDLYDAYAKVANEQLRQGVLEERLKSENESIQRDNAKGNSFKAITSAQAIKEIHADIGGGLALQPKFWQRMIELDASAAKRLLYHFMRVATKLIRVAKGSKYDVSRYVKDVEAVRDAYAKALTAKSARGSKPAADTSKPQFERQDSPRRDGGYRMSVARTQIEGMPIADVRDDLVSRHGLTRAAVDAMTEQAARNRLLNERHFERNAANMATPSDVQRQIDAAVEAGARKFDKMMARADRKIDAMREFLDAVPPTPVRQMTDEQLRSELYMDAADTRGMSRAELIKEVNSQRGAQAEDRAGERSRRAVNTSPEDEVLGRRIRARSGEMEPTMTPEDEARLNTLGAFNLDNADIEKVGDEAYPVPDPEGEAMAMREREERDRAATITAGIDGQENFKKDQKVTLDDVNALGMFGEEAFTKLVYQQGDPSAKVHFALALTPSNSRTRTTYHVNRDQSRPERDGLWVNSPPQPNADPAGRNLGHWHGVRDEQSVILDNQLTYASLWLHGSFPGYWSKDVSLRYDLAVTVPSRARKAISKVWRQIGEIPGALRYHKSGKVVTNDKAAMLQEIADRMLMGSQYSMTDVMVEDAGRGFNVLMKDGKTGKQHTAMIEYVPAARQAGALGPRLVFHTTDLPKGGGMGSAFYQIGQEFAYQLGVGTQADKMGLSGINTRRRTEQMLSAAVRNPIGGNFRPGFGQRVYGWNPETRNKDNIDMNLTRLAIASLRNTAEVVPEVRKGMLSYNIATGQFSVHGRPVPNVDDILARPMVRDLGISRSQLARAAITSDIIKGKDPSAGVQQAAEDVLFHRELDEGDTDQYAVYRGREVTVPVRVGDTGRTAEMTIDLGRAFEDLDNRESALRRLRECVS